MSDLGNKSSLCNESPGVANIAQAAFLIFILILTVLGNGMVIATVFINRRLRSSPANFFIANLAVSDLLVALVSMPLRIHQTLHNMIWCLSLEACSLWVWSDMICSGTSVGNLAMISVDRYLALSRPLHYRMRVTTTRAFTGIALLWIYFSIWACLSFINWTNFGTQSIFIKKECTKSDPVYYTVVMSTAFFLPLLIFLFNYSRIFGIARKQARSLSRPRIKRNQVQPVNPGIQRAFMTRTERNFKATKTIALVGCVFIVCWVPFVVIFIVSLWCAACIRKLQTYSTLFMFIKVVFVYLLPAINSCLNPGIYALYNKEFRGALKDTLLKVFGSKYLVRKQRHELSLSLQHTNGREIGEEMTTGNGAFARYAVNETYQHEYEEQ